MREETSEGTARRKTRDEAWYPTEAPPLYSQDGKGYDATVHAHYFAGACDWLVTEYDPEEGIAFGWACLGDRDMAELGYVSLKELADTRFRAQITVNHRDGGGRQVVEVDGLPVERDRHWPDGLTLTEALAYLDKAAGR